MTWNPDHGPNNLEWEKYTMELTAEELLDGLKARLYQPTQDAYGKACLYELEQRLLMLVGGFRNTIRATYYVATHVKWC